MSVLSNRPKRAIAFDLILQKFAIQRVDAIILYFVLLLFCCTASVSFRRVCELTGAINGMTSDNEDAILHAYAESDPRSMT